MGLMTAALITYAGVSMYQSYQQGEAQKREMKEAEKRRQSMPQAPKIGDAQAKAQEAMVQRRKAVGRHKGIHTSPLGIAGEAQVAKKTLLGQ